jgi:peptide/nickel transport system permease protein
MAISLESEAFLVAAPRQVQVRERGYWGEAWRHLRRDRVAMAGLALVALLIAAGLFAPVLAPYDPNEQFWEGLTVEGRPMPPGTPSFLLGTDALGRDELSRALYGARISLAVGIGANLFAAALGVVIGGIAGLARGRGESAIMRAIDVVLSFPILLLAITLLAVTPPSVATIVVIIGISFGAYLARLVYGQVASLREREFVLAARACGAGRGRILLRHIVPHVIPAALVFATLGVATAIQLEAALSYVGIGIRPPRASWGNMIAEGQTYILSAPWLVLVPGLAIVLAMVGFSLLGDGLRDALDPTLQGRGGRR